MVLHHQACNQGFSQKKWRSQRILLVYRKCHCECRVYLSTCTSSVVSIDAMLKRTTIASLVWISSSFLVHSLEQVKIATTIVFRPGALPPPSPITSWTLPSPKGPRPVRREARNHITALIQPLPLTWKVWTTRGTKPIIVVVVEPNPGDTHLTWPNLGTVSMPRRRPRMHKWTS